jgi:hypothetical protein
MVNRASLRLSGQTRDGLLTKPVNECPGENEMKVCQGMIVAAIIHQVRPFLEQPHLDRLKVLMFEDIMGVS